ncbi:MAG: YdcF family protein [Actinomycetota bacterium]|nr:YdcF family protein [Actinomycetota bacterium]
MVGLLLLSKTVRRVLLAVVLSGLLIVAGTAARVWWVARQDEHPRSDAIVVMGASQFDGRPSTVFRARLLHARELFLQGVAPVVVTVGGSAPGDRFTEAEAGATFLRDRGVSVLPVGIGRDSLQSLRAVKEEFARRGWRTAVIVTDPWHSLRARRMATDLGIAAHTSPVRAGPAVRDRSTEARYIARETAAYLFYRLFHTSSEAGPQAV